MAGGHDDKINHALKVLIAASLAEASRSGLGRGVIPKTA